MPDLVYDHLPNMLMRGKIDLEEDALFLMLTDTYKPHHSHETVSQVKGGEIVAVGYVGGGKQLQNVQVINDTLHADSVLWTRSAIRARNAVFYAHDSGLLIGCWDLGGERESTANGDFFLPIPAEGLLQLFDSGPGPAVLSDASQEDAGAELARLAGADPDKKP